MKRRMVKQLFLYIATFVVLIWILAPVLWLVSASLQMDYELFTRPPNFLPARPTLDNYRYVITGVAPPAYAMDVGEPTAGGIGRRASAEALATLPAMRNSFIVAGLAMLLNLLFTVPAAYSISRVKFKGKAPAIGFIMASRLVPPIAVAVPIFVIVDRLGLLDSHIALTIVYVSFTLPFTIWFMAKFFTSMPNDLEDAAMVDGCSTFQTLVRIVIPVVKPGLAATGAFAFMISYSDFLFAMLITRSMASRTVPVVLSAAAINFDVSYALASTGVVLALIPPVLIALVLRRYITSGLSMAFDK